MLRTAGQVRGLAGCGLFELDKVPEACRVSAVENYLSIRELETHGNNSFRFWSFEGSSHVDVRCEKSYEFFFLYDSLPLTTKNFSPRELSSLRSPAANKFQAGKRFLPLQTMLLSVKLSLEFFARRHSLD